MKMQLGILVLGLSLQTLASASSSNVVSLDRNTFDLSIESNPVVMVNFCIPGTSACEDLYQEFEKAALNLKSLKDTSPTLATVDCLKEADLCNKYNVISYPTIRVFEGPEKMTRYRDSRKADFITSHAIKKSPHILWKLQRGQEVKDFIALNSITLILRANPKDEKAIKAFSDIATSVHGSLSFALEVDPKLPSKGLLGPEIVLYKSFGWEKIPFLAGTISKNQLLKFVQEYWKPLMPELNQTNYATYMEEGRPLAYLFASTRIERDYYRTVLNHLNEKQRNLINFVVMDSWEWFGHAQELGLETFPAFVIHDTPSKKNYIFDTKEKEISVKHIDEFVDEYVADQRAKAARRATPVHAEL